MVEHSSVVRLIRADSLTDAVSYAYAATTDGPTRPVFLAGACPLDDDGQTVAPGNVPAQTGRCVETLIAALGAAWAHLEDVIYTRVLVATTERNDLVAAWDVVSAAFGDHNVPSTLHGVTVLGYPDQLVEIEAVAVVPDMVMNPR